MPKKHAKGKALEALVNRTNIRYRTSGKAMILYKGTPVTITKKGCMLEKGPPDFEGLLTEGRYISFDAKETQSTTSFSLSGIREHQLTHLKLVNRLGGIGFFLVHFYNLHDDKAYKIPVEFILPYWDAWKFENGRASIPVKDLKPEWLVDIDNYLEVD